MQNEWSLGNRHKPLDGLALKPVLVRSDKPMKVKGVLSRKLIKLFPKFKIFNAVITRCKCRICYSGTPVLHYIYIQMNVIVVLWARA